MFLNGKTYKMGSLGGAKTSTFRGRFVTPFPGPLQGK